MPFGKIRNFFSRWKTSSGLSETSSGLLGHVVEGERQSGEFPLVNNQTEVDIRDVYEIGRILGSGSFGQVREARLKGGVQVDLRAVKIVESDDSDGEWSRQVVFVREVGLLQQLDHENIVKFYDFFADSLFYYIVMELYQGGELFQKILEVKRFSECDAGYLGFQMLLALDYIHSSGIVHRDVKAENFLFTIAGTSIYETPLKLIDFGMAVKRSDENTLLHELCGSPHYLAPELIGQQYNNKVDLWAMGVLLYLLLYGRYPYDAKDPQELMVKILTEDIEWSHSKAKISDGAKGFLNSLLDRNVQTRYTATKALRHHWICQNMMRSESLLKPINKTNITALHFIHTEAANIANISKTDGQVAKTLPKRTSREEKRSKEEKGNSSRNENSRNESSSGRNDGSGKTNEKRSSRKKVSQISSIPKEDLPKDTTSIISPAKESPSSSIIKDSTKVVNTETSNTANMAILKQVTVSSEALTMYPSAVRISQADGSEKQDEEKQAVVPSGKILAKPIPDISRDSSGSTLVATRLVSEKGDNSGVSPASSGGGPTFVDGKGPTLLEVENKGSDTRENELSSKEKSEASKEKSTKSKSEEKSDDLSKEMRSEIPSDTNSSEEDDQYDVCSDVPLEIPKEVLHSARRSSIATRKLVDNSFNMIRNAKLEALESDYRNGVKHGHRMITPSHSQIALSNAGNVAGQSNVVGQSVTSVVTTVAHSGTGQWGQVGGSQINLAGLQGPHQGSIQVGGSQGNIVPNSLQGTLHLQGSLAGQQGFQEGFQGHSSIAQGQGWSRSVDVEKPKPAQSFAGRLSSKIFGSSGGTNRGKEVRASLPAQQITPGATTHNPRDARNTFTGVGGAPLGLRNRVVDPPNTMAGNSTMGGFASNPGTNSIASNLIGSNSIGTNQRGQVSGVGALPNVGGVAGVVGGVNTSGGGPASSSSFFIKNAVPKSTSFFLGSGVNNTNLQSSQSTVLANGASMNNGSLAAQLLAARKGPLTQNQLNQVVPGQIPGSVPDPSINNEPDAEPAGVVGRISTMSTKHGDGGRTSALSTTGGAIPVKPVLRKGYSSSSVADNQPKKVPRRLSYIGHMTPVHEQQLSNLYKDQIAIEEGESEET